MGVFQQTVVRVCYILNISNCVGFYMPLFQRHFSHKYVYKHVQTQIRAKFKP